MMPLLENAHAQTGATGSAGMELLIMVGIFFLIMYFMIIRPQNKRAKEHRALLAALQKGDEVGTTGGLMGRVAKIGESTVRLELAEGIEIRLRKDAVSSVLPKGSLAKSD